jgi:nucleoside 2-deoxyribosyltransferase
MQYVDPEVHLLNQLNAPHVGFFLWMKSRQWVVTELGPGTTSNFMTLFDVPYDGWLDNVPEKFYVGKELVEKSEYLNRIEKMNLQYNNMDYYVFEIQGSCLFRDFLFNVSKIAEWAQSNRFLFSILDDKERYNEDCYWVSSEYKGKIKWETQFKIYMNAIKNDPIVDHNRLEMPYSISSLFWIGVNKKTLMDIISYMKKYIPFFYYTYGIKFENEIPGLSEMIPSNPSATMYQYLMSYSDYTNFTEGTTKSRGTYLIDTKMGMILYSQFIRQADTIISGFYNLLNKSDPVNGNVVIKGGTILNVHYVASEAKVKSTVSTRLCAFAMSSGDGPCSWSYFINNFISNIDNPRDFMKLLPCRFHHNQLADCKFKDDIKFRYDGTEKSNIPCPIFTGSIADASKKRSRDKNKIGNLYYDTVSYLNTNGLGWVYNLHAWTSDLLIKSDEELPQSAKSYIENMLSDLESKYNEFNCTEKSITYIDSNINSLAHALQGATLFPGYDVTSAMKGVAIGKIVDYFSTMFTGMRYIISFGGDMYIHNTSTKVKINRSKFTLDLSDDFDWTVFTSGNTEDRGNHITGCDSNKFVTVVSRHPRFKGVDSVSINFCNIDAYATKCAANDITSINSKLLESLISNKSHVTWKLYFSKGGNDSNDYSLENQVYCASPFFNEVQVEIRDKMVSRFTDAFRPDLTEESKQYNELENYDTVKSVVSSNEKGIVGSDFLVYPSRTTDLGTLYEVGYAIGRDRPVIRYDEELGEYILTCLDYVKTQKSLAEKYKIRNLKSSLIFDCSSKVDVINLGYVSSTGIVSSDRIYYELNGKPDNIMLSAKFHHVELSDDETELIEYERDKEDKDK